MTIGEYLKEFRQRRGISQRQFATICNVSNSYISMLEAGKNPHTGAPIKPTIDSLVKIAAGMGTTLDELLSSVDTFLINVGADFDPLAYGLTPIPNKNKVPRLGRIPCGEPAEMYQNIEAYDELPEGIAADYTLVCEGDSMINAKIEDGDIVYIRQQETVDNGEIAAVWYDGATTLKRFYQNGEAVTLMPENPRYEPIFISGENLTRLQILGKAVGFTRIFK